MWLFDSIATCLFAGKVSSCLLDLAINPQLLDEECRRVLFAIERDRRKDLSPQEAAALFAREAFRRIPNDALTVPLTHLDLAHRCIAVMGQWTRNRTMRSEVAETIGSAMIELAAPNAPPTNLPPRPPEERAVEQTSASCKGSAPSNTEQEIRGKWEARSTAFGDRMTLIIYDTIDDSLRPGTTGYIPPELFKHFLPQYGRVIEKVLTAAPASFDILDLVETAAGGRKGDGARAIIARRMGNKYVYADPMPLIPGYADFHSICKLLFVACELPAMTAWDHGLYDRDDHIVLSEQHLHNSIRNMMARPMAPEEVPALLDIPAGVRLLRDGDDLIVSTLVCSFTRGIGEHSLRIRKDTSVEDLGVRRIVPVPGMVLY